MRKQYGGGGLGVCVGGWGWGIIATEPKEDQRAMIYTLHILVKQP